MNQRLKMIFEHICKFLKFSLLHIIILIIYSNIFFAIFSRNKYYNFSRGPGQLCTYTIHYNSAINFFKEKNFLLFIEFPTSITVLQ